MPSPSPLEKKCFAIFRAFLLLFLHIGALLLHFSHLGGGGSFSPSGGRFATFTAWWVFFGACMVII